MFPTLQLFSHIQCPLQEKCTRGSVCLFAHSADTCGRPNAAPESRRDSTVEAEAFSTEEITLSSPPIQQPSPRKAPPAASEAVSKLVATKPVVAKPMAAKSGRPKPAFQPQKHAIIASNPVIPPSAADKGGGTQDDGDKWRLLTLNYDRRHPGYDPKTETQVVAPQLRAIVGDRIGYAKRQKSIQLMFDIYLKLRNGEWVGAAEDAVERELGVYRSSGPGSYHVNLVNSLRQLKRQMST